MDKDTMTTDKMVEFARFSRLQEAQILLSLLESEGIECYLRNEFTTQVMYPANMGGVRIELLESELEHAIEVIEANGYEFPEDEEPEQIQTVTGWTSHIPFLRNCPLEKQIIILFLLVAVLLALFIYFGSLSSSN